jgi:hypothetical protein
MKAYGGWMYRFKFFLISALVAHSGCSTPGTHWIRGFLGDTERLARKADNLTAICEPTVKKMWKPRRLTALWASTASHRIALPFII